jgi:hypothetical protein
MHPNTSYTLLFYRVFLISEEKYITILTKKCGFIGIVLKCELF